MIGIYKIQNLINQKVYIGQSKNISMRWRNHRYNAKSNDESINQYPLYRAINKYGIENFLFEILEECSIEDLDIREKYWIKEYNSIVPNGYNQTEGGEGCITFSKLSPEAVEEIQKKLLSGNYMIKTIAEEYEVHRDTIRDINLGRTWVKEEFTYPLYLDRAQQGKLGLLKNYCINCGVEILKESTRCVNCNNKLGIKGNYPSNKEEIIQDITNLGFVGASKKYGVSDNALRKHCVKIGLSKYKSDYKKNSTVLDSKPKTELISQYDLQGNFIQTFTSCSEAGKWCVENGYAKKYNGGVRSHILEAIKGNRKTAYKFIWRYAE